jgi:O-acetyl-ADP-ribose deacetylase (regulator of RNase III)
MSTHISVAAGDLTRGSESVLINASNTGAWLGSGVSGAISRACGAAFQDQVLAQLKARFGGDMKPGQVLVTDAGQHRTARYVAHVAVMDYRPGTPAGKARPDEARIELGCQNLWESLEALPDAGLTVARPALGAGTGGLGVRQPTEIACRTLKAHLASHPDRIAGVVFYGYALHEQLVVAEVVLAELGPQVSLPDEIRENLPPR